MNEETMKRYYAFVRLFLFALGFAVSLVSCDNLSETPEINRGYKSSIRVPEGEPLTDEDRDFIDAQEMEYEDNVG